MFDKTSFIIKNKLMIIPDDDLIIKCLNTNHLIANLAQEELVRRHPINFNVTDDLLIEVINKLSLEQIYELVSENVDTRLCILAYKRLSSILDEYDRIHEDRKIREKIHLLK